MKFVALTVLALVAAVYAAPTSISDNNIGDIINVGINADIKIDNKVDQDIVNVILAYLNQQAIVIAPNLPGEDPTPFKGESQEDPAAIIAKLFQH